MRADVKIVLKIFAAGAVILLIVACENNNEGSYSAGLSGTVLEERSEEKTINRDEAIESFWDEIKDYVSGTETIDACSSESGNCYGLDADISDGDIGQVYFDNGGYLYFSAEIDENGSASDIDQDGNIWDFTIDMDSSIIEDAVSNWAGDNNYTIE